MARQVAAFPDGPRRYRSKSDRFLDGQTWELERGVDGENLSQMAQAIYRRARALGLAVKIRRDERRGTLTVKRIGSRADAAAAKAHVG